MKRYGEAEVAKLTDFENEIIKLGIEILHL
jgi:hypothetical protein